ncbi:MAG: beta-1,3-glucanase family protein [Rickettsiaceae bacterium]
MKAQEEKSNLPKYKEPVERKMNSADANDNYTMKAIIKNNTGFLNEQVYINIQGKTTGEHHCFVDLGGGKSSIVPTFAGMNTMQYGFNLRTLSGHNGGDVEINIPQITEGHIFFSMGRPLKFEINKATLHIQDINPEITTSINHYTLYDKINLTFNQTGSWISPTAIDFFSMPIHISQKGLVARGAPCEEVGFSKSRGEILQSVEQTLSKSDTWKTLIKQFEDTTLRVISPTKSASFPKYYLNNYLQDVWWNYTKDQPNLQIYCEQIRKDMPALQAYQFHGYFEGGLYFFANANGLKVTVSQPNATSFFAETPYSLPDNSTPESFIARVLTAAYNVGFIPTPDNDAWLSTPYFIANRAQFFTNHYSNDPNNPYYNLYSKALHDANDKNPIYTNPCENALFAIQKQWVNILGQAGTLYDTVYADIKPITITLGNLSLNALPDPLKNHYYDKVIIRVNQEATEKLHVKFWRPAEPAELGGQFILLDNNVDVQLADVTTPILLQVNKVDQHIYTKPNFIEPTIEGLTEGFTFLSDADGVLNMTFSLPHTEEHKMLDLAGASVDDGVNDL